MTAIALPLNSLQLPSAAAARFRAELKSVVLGGRSNPSRTALPPHAPVEAESEGYLASAARSRAASLFD